MSKKIEIEKKQTDFIKKKKLSQPSQIKTCGSTFKNISKEKKAWMLIKESGCENYKEGDATISKKHSNFFEDLFRLMHVNQVHQQLLVGFEGYFYIFVTI